MIIHGDCLAEMPKLEPQSIDLVITSPPYNVGIAYGKNGREADKRPFDEYVTHARATMIQITRLLKVGGRACIEIGGSGRNMPLSWAWQDAAYKAGLGLYSEITIAHRKSNPTAWGSYLKSDNVYTIANFHMLYVFYSQVETKRGKESDINKDEWMEWTRGRWKVNWSHPAGRRHPATFPPTIPIRCMKLFGHTDDTILDPYCGIGTTLRAAKDLGRSAIGIEIQEQYVKIAKDNLRQEVLL